MSDRNSRSTYDPVIKLQQSINNAGIDRRRVIQHGSQRAGGAPSAVGMFAFHELTCEGENCTGGPNGTRAKTERFDSRDTINEAHSKGLTSDEDIQQYIIDALRYRAFAAGWVARGEDRAQGIVGRDYCPDCAKRGKAPGDTSRPGAGRRRMRRGEG